MKPKAQSTKEKVDKLDFVKIETFCASKDTFPEWQKIFDKDLVSRIYK